MNDSVIHLRRAGAAERVVADYLAVVEGGRHAGTAAPEVLARIVAGVALGPNRDSPLRELCNLLTAVDAAGFTGTEGRWEFFFGPERVSPGGLEAALRERLDAGGWRRDGVRLGDRGVELNYPDGDFEIRFSRMPVLVALFDFFATMDEGRAFSLLDDTASALGAASPTLRRVGDASNALARRFRDYRHGGIEWARHEEKFDRIAGFLGERGEKGRWRIDDEAIFAFWVLHWQAKGFREYRSVFEAFVDLSTLCRAGGLAAAADDAAPLGADCEAGEIDVDEDDVAGDYGEWENPLPTFDDPDLKQIRFFKGASERDPLELLMRHGPEAVRFAHAFLRLESFAPIQAGITNDLRIGRGAGSVRARITCNDAAPYPEHDAGYERLADHLRTLQLATLHVVGGDLEEEQTAAARRAFDGLRRKGFDAQATDEPRREAFVRAAEALVRGGWLLARMRGRLAAMDSNDTGLAGMFERDVAEFSRQFGTIYGDRT